jgi:NAD(P)-dependent dehydrogenase (short-subunit alcohol dehydrogenase family)
LATIAAGDPRLVAAPCDITDPASIAKALDGRAVALAVLNAGTWAASDITRFDLAQFRTQVEVNLVGTAACIGALLPAMLQRGRGQIAIVSSVAGYRGLPRAAGYGASKAGLINLAESLRLELAPRGVLVSLVNPGFVKTPMTDVNDFPMPFLMQPEAAARRLVDGIGTSRFETTFPRRFTWLLKLLRVLPYPLYLALAGRAVKR